MVTYFRGSITVDKTASLESAYRRCASLYYGNSLQNLIKVQSHFHYHHRPLAVHQNYYM